MIESNLSSYDYALDKIQELIQRVVKDNDELIEFMEIIDSSRRRKTVPIRGIQNKLMSYRERNNFYVAFTKEERELLRDLFDYWG